MRKIKPHILSSQHPGVNAERMAYSPFVDVKSYLELCTKVAELASKNKDHVLFYRGEEELHESGVGRLKHSTFYPSMYRGTVSQKKLDLRWDVLKNASDKLLSMVKLCPSITRNDKLLLRKSLVRWCILQHYGVCETPLLDMTQSLRVACSFATLNNCNPEGYAYVYVFALPYVTNRISINSEHELTNIRLLSISPSNAMRPFLQEGFLVGEDEFLSKYSRKSDLDFGRRLVCKFRFSNNDSFWNDAPALNKQSLFPDDDIMKDICSQIKEEMYKLYPLE